MILFAVGMTDRGLIRDNNEDAFALLNEPIGALPNLYIVADGMGGHNYGEVASSVAIESFLEFIKNKIDTIDYMDLLIEGVNYANRKVFEMAQTDLKYLGMGTTFTVCTIIENRCYIVHIGDSRCYLINEKEIKMITTDHTYVNEMVKAGQITKKEAIVHPNRSALIKALGVDESVEVDGYVMDFYDGDKILICSDGLTDMVLEESIFEIVNAHSDIKISADKLIETAKSNGGSDNITVILAKAGR